VATALVAAYGTWWPVACYAIFLSLCTVVAIWFGPETYKEDIAAVAPASREELPAAMPQQA
jgi:hypothetical protein